MMFAQNDSQQSDAWQNENSQNAELTKRLVDETSLVETSWHPKT
jgi:hypothetical protein